MVKLCVACALTAFAAAGEQPRNSIHVTEVASGHVREPLIATDSAGSIHLVWSDTDIHLGQSKVLYVQSSDHGASFSSPVIISSVNPRQPYLTTAKDGTIFVLWVDARQQRIMVAASKDGITFSRPRNVALGDSPSAAVDREGVLYVSWEVLVTNHFEIRVAHSHDQGVTFSKPETITENAQGFRSPAIAIGQDGVPVVAWEGSGISVSRSENGSAFSTVSLARGLGSEDHLPQIKTAGEKHVYITWEAVGPKQYAIMFSRSEDRGKTFSLPAKIFSSSAAAWDPKLDVAADGTIIVVWSSSADATLFRQLVSFSRSIDGGSTFSRPTTFSDYPISFHPSVSVDRGGNSYFVWERWKSATDPTTGSDLLLLARPDLERNSAR
jgi:hypothetical protein